MQSLKSIIFAGALLALLPIVIGCDDMTPATAIRLLNDPVHPDARRQGIASVATRWDFGKRPPYPGYYQTFAQHDPDFTVRAMAIRALNICRDASATPIFINGLKDDSELVRLESAKALANVPDPEAKPALLRALAGSRSIMTPDGRYGLVAENMDVRIAAADALRQYHTLDVARELVNYLNEVDFGVAWQSRQSLIRLTGQDLRYDESAWLQYLVGPAKPFG